MSGSLACARRDFNGASLCSAVEPPRPAPTSAARPRPPGRPLPLLAPLDEQRRGLRVVVVGQLIGRLALVERSPVGSNPAAVESEDRPGAVVAAIHLSGHRHARAAPTPPARGATPAEPTVANPRSEPVTDLQPEVPTLLDAPRRSNRWELGVLVEHAAGDELVITRAYLNALCDAYQVDARLVPFERLDDLARDLAEGCLDAVFALRASEVPVVEGCTATVLTFDNARVWFAGRARTPALAVYGRRAPLAGAGPETAGEGARNLQSAALFSGLLGPTE